MKQLRRVKHFFLNCLKNDLRHTFTHSIPLKIQLWCNRDPKIRRCSCTFKFHRLENDFYSKLYCLKYIFGDS